MNILISNISAIGGRFSLREIQDLRISEYKFENDTNSIQGVITNEPSIKLVMRELKKQEDKLDYIVAIVSDKASEIVFENKSTYKILQERLSDFCEDEGI
nr:hypothetical protein [Lachnospiraceae bacterium]